MRLIQFETNPQLITNGYLEEVTHQLSHFIPLPPPFLFLYLYQQTALEYITMAALSKIFAVAMTYPYQVVRARLQDQHNRYNGMIDVISRTWRYDPSGFFYEETFCTIVK